VAFRVGYAERTGRSIEGFAGVAEVTVAVNRQNRPESTLHHILGAEIPIGLSPLPPPLLRVAGWLAGARSPVLVQLPRDACERLRGPWGLPDFPA
jgi:hypothetical protein